MGADKQPRLLPPPADAVHEDSLGLDPENSRELSWEDPVGLFHDPGPDEVYSGLRDSNESIRDLPKAHRPMTERSTFHAIIQKAWGDETPAAHGMPMSCSCPVLSRK